MHRFRPIPTTVLTLLSLSAGLSAADAPPLKVATFRADVTPPLGTPLCGGGVAPAKIVVDPLSARGIVLLTDDAPIVLCAVDWVGIGNGGYDAWREALARAAGTTPQRVAVHAVHQHDTPGCDFDAANLLAEHGLEEVMFSVKFAREAIARTGAAIREAVRQPRLVTHVGQGQAAVERVASNRRVLGDDGKVKHVRYSSCRNPEAIAAPEGVIDPDVRLISFWNDKTLIASLTYYATHPQSFYGRGAISSDFVGLARGLREATLPDVLHVHFNGAGGNVAAGKYNDGTPPRRFELANRLADGMSRAFDAIEKQSVTGHDVAWRIQPVALPLRDIIDEESCLETLADAKARLADRIRAARDLTWARRCKAGGRIDLTCLRIGSVRVVHMPGELFVEYQLAARDLRRESMVCMAAYGDYGPGYIGTEISYGQGGYETSRVSRVGPQVESVLMAAMKQLLE